MPKRLPLKLNRAPLVEAVCQICVSGPGAIHTFFPGVMLAQYQGEVTNIEQLPQSMIPEQVRIMHPEFSLQPLVQFRFKGLLIMVGSRMVTVSNPKPYLGWAAFKPLIVEVFKVLLSSTPNIMIDRVSMKYTNVLTPAEVPNPLAALDWQLSVGALPLSMLNSTLRSETKTDDLTTILTLAGGVTAQAPGFPPVQGSMIDMVSADFLKIMDFELDKVRKSNKEAFFECLTDEAINALEPIYE